MSVYDDERARREARRLSSSVDTRTREVSMQEWPGVVRLPNGWTSDPVIEREYARVPPMTVGSTYGVMRWQNLAAAKLTKREVVRAFAEWACRPANSAHIGYSTVRPANIHVSPGALQTLVEHAGGQVDVVGWDCSAFTDWLYLWAGAKDPGGVGYSGNVNTQVFAAHLARHYTNSARALTAAIGIFGLEGPLAVQHAVVHIDDSGVEDPWVASHGSEAGPLRLRLSDEVRAHPNQSFAWLSVGGCFG